MTMMSPLSKSEKSTLFVPEFKNAPAPVGTVSACSALASISGTFFESTGWIAGIGPVPTVARAVPGTRHSASAATTAAMIFVRISFDTSDVRNTCTSGATCDTTAGASPPRYAARSSLHARRTAVTNRDRRRLTRASGDVAIRGLHDGALPASLTGYLPGALRGRTSAAEGGTIAEGDVARHDR